MTMWKRWKAPAALLVPLVAGACVIEISGLDDVWWDDEATESVTRIVDVSGQATVRIEGVNGTIHVVAVPGSGVVSVHATKRVRSSSRHDAETRLDDLEVQVWSTATEIRVETVQPVHTSGREYVVDYEIELPDDLALVGINGNGDFVIEDLRADVNLKVGNGNVRARRFQGTGRIESGNGNLNIAMVLPPGGEVALVGGNGNVTLTVEPDVSAELQAQVGNGTITVSGLDMVTHTSQPHLLKCTFGDGDGAIGVVVGNGSIRIEAGPVL